MTDEQYEKWKELIDKMIGDLPLDNEMTHIDGIVDFRDELLMYFKQGLEVVLHDTDVSGTDINWVEIGTEDYKAEYKGFFLRLESMDKNWWWFQVYDENEPLWHEGNFVSTKKEAEQKMRAQIKTLNTL